MDITLKRENVIRMTDSEERAKALEAQGFKRLPANGKKTLKEDVPPEIPEGSDSDPTEEDAVKTSAEENGRGKKSVKKE